MNALLLIPLTMALTGCAPVYRSPLYPDTFSVVVRTGNRTSIDGLNVGLAWKLQPRAVEIVSGAPGN